MIRILFQISQSSIVAQPACAFQRHVTLSFSFIYCSVVRESSFRAVLAMQHHTHLIHVPSLLCLLYLLPCLAARSLVDCQLVSRVYYQYR